MAERYRSGVRGINENPQPYFGGLFFHALAGALALQGIIDQNLAMVGAGALIFGGYEGRRWFLNKRRERQKLQQIEPPRPAKFRIY